MANQNVFFGELLRHMNFWNWYCTRCVVAVSTKTHLGFFFSTRFLANNVKFYSFTRMCCCWRNEWWCMKSKTELKQHLTWQRKKHAGKYMFRSYRIYTERFFMIGFNRALNTNNRAIRLWSGDFAATEFTQQKIISTRAPNVVTAACCNVQFLLLFIAWKIFLQFRCEQLHFKCWKRPVKCRSVTRFRLLRFS